MTGSAVAAPLTWSEALPGLDGGLVSEILVDPRDPERAVALAPNAGVFTTADGARTWKMAALPASDAYARLRRDPADPQVLFVSTSRGPHVSKDGGATWAPAGAAVPGTGLVGLELDPKSKGAVRYLRENLKFDKKSTDGGKTWQSWTGGEAFDAVAISPADSQRIYAVNSRGVWASRDGGKTWGAAASLAELGFPSSVVADAASADTLVVGCEKGVARSTDGGATWKQAGGIDPEKAMGFGLLSPDASDPKRIYAVIQDEENDVLHVSQDAGVSFSAVTTLPGPFMNTIAVAPSKPERLYTGAALGVVRSDDRGKTWQKFDAGLTARGTSSFALHPSEPATVYHVSGVGLARSTDAGATWVALPAPPEVISPQKLLIHPTEPKVMLLVGLYRVAITIDGGASWSALKKPPVSGKLSAAFDTSVPGGAYMTVRRPDGDPLRVATADGGGSWKAAPPLPVERAFTLGPASETGLTFCDDAEVTKFLVNPDRPLTRPDWMPGSPTKSPPVLPSLIARAPSNPQVIYLAWARGALARSADGGKTWESRKALDQGCGEVNALAVDPDDPDRLYVAADTGTVVSTDGGATPKFDALGFELDVLQRQVTVVAVVPVKPRVLLLGTKGRVFRATIPEPGAK